MANVICQGDAWRGCETNSRGYRFLGANSDEAVRRCQVHPSTNNGECMANVVCRGHRGR
jgi:hypothetical protein